MSDSNTPRVSDQDSPDEATPHPRALELERTIGYLGQTNADSAAVLPLLAELVKTTLATSTLGARARVALATKLLSGEPQLGPATNERAWLCARLCREARLGPLNTAERAVSFALSGLAFSILGCYRAASHAYYQSLREDPDDPVVAHNLGHLLHVRLMKPLAALRWLRQAHVQLPKEPEVAASYAYALHASGEVDSALDVLASVFGSRSRARAEIAKWQ